MKRADYQVVLHQTALAAGCELRLGAKVVSVDEDAPAVTLASGEEVRGDLVIVADGMPLSWTDAGDGPADICV